MFCEKCGSKMKESGKVHICLNDKCEAIRYDNAKSVSVVLIPVLDKDNSLKLVGVRRGEDPKIGEVALPGGFQERESSKAAGIREVEEETGMNISILSDEVLNLSTPDGTKNLIFFVGELESLNNIDFSFKTKETLEVLLIDIGTPLAFPLHEKAVKWFYEKHAEKFILKS